MRKYLTLQQAAALLPVKVSVSTVWRWSVNGFYIPAVDQIIRLQHARIGGRLFTTEEWLERFVEDLTAARALERERLSGKGVGRKWERLVQLYQAEVVLRRAGI